MGAAEPPSGHVDVPGKGPVAHEVALEDLVHRAVALDDAGRPAGRQIVHPAHARVGVVDQVGVAVAGDNQDVVDALVGADHVARQLEGHQGRAAALLHVEGPGPFLRPSSFWIFGPTGQLRYSLTSSPLQITRSMSRGARPE